jgi:hypothetical protein
MALAVGRKSSIIWEYFTPIRAVVPNLPPVTYPITRHSGAQQVSKSSTSFKVNQDSGRRLEAPAAAVSCLNAGGF